MLSMVALILSNEFNHVDINFIKYLKLVFFSDIQVTSRSTDRWEKLVPNRSATILFLLPSSNSVSILKGKVACKTGIWNLPTLQLQCPSDLCWLWWNAESWRWWSHRHMGLVSLCLRNPISRNEIQSKNILEMKLLLRI